MKMNRKVRMIIGIVALVIIIAIIVIIAVNGGKSNRGSSDPEPTATVQPATPSAQPSDNASEATPTAEPQESADPATDGNLGEEVPVTDTNLPSQELINELIDEYQKQNDEDK